MLNPALSSRHSGMRHWPALAGGASPESITPVSVRDTRIQIDPCGVFVFDETNLQARMEPSASPHAVPVIPAKAGNQYAHHPCCETITKLAEYWVPARVRKTTQERCALGGDDRSCA